MLYHVFEYDHIKLSTETGNECIVVNILAEEFNFAGSYLGGTGLSMLLRGLKTYSSNLTAVVTVADDGGSSGLLRRDMHVIPPGDIRNCIAALADAYAKNMAKLRSRPGFSATRQA